MATSVYPAQSGASTVTTQANFIPELWSDQVRAAFKSRIVMAAIVKQMPMTGKKGDTINIPAPSRGSVTAKTAGTAVTIQNDTASSVAITIDKHFEYSRLLEDIAALQELASSQEFYTDDCGYALSKNIDTNLHNLGKNLGDGDGSSWVNSASFYVDASSGLATYAVDTVTTSDVLTDAGFRALIVKQDDNDVPFDKRYFVIPPSARSTMMGIDRYVSTDFVSGRGVDNGKIGNIYGIDIMVSTNCPVTETASENSAGGELKAAVLLQEASLVLSMQQDVRVQTQYKQEWLADLLTGDVLYGSVAYRPDSAFNLVVNS
tara:strand:+ start:4620 stop:5573 length:954 start_codon:yes stop_codon:yes gene_type:complete